MRATPVIAVPLFTAPLFTALLSACVSPATSLEADTAPIKVLPKQCPGCEVIRHVTVLDADGRRADRRVAIWDGGIVLEEADDGPLAQVVSELDGTGHTLIPGMWDSHVHLMSSDDGFSTTDYVPESLKSFVYSGVTSVIDLGADGKTTAAMRARLATLELIGPRVFAAGRFVTAPGGHPCTGWAPQVCTPIGPGATAEDAIAGLMPLEPDLVKIIIESGGAPVPSFPRLTSAEIAAVTAAAHARGLKVAAHVSKLEDLDDALDAGVDMLAHLPAWAPMTDAQAELVAARKTPVITTLSFYDGLPRLLDHPEAFMEPHVVQTVPPQTLTLFKNSSLLNFYLFGMGVPVTAAWRANLANMKQSLQKVKAKGGVLVAGSDCGNFAVFHGPGLVRELELMVDAGLTTTEAIASATAAPAQMMGKGSELGRVRAGYRADLVLVSGDVGADIGRLESPSEVWLSGRRLDRSKLTVTRPRSDLIVTPRGQAENGFCVVGADCIPPFRCDERSWRCTRPCSAGDAGTCSAGFGCVDGFCTASAGCDPVLQNCPFAAAYGSTCVPQAAGFTACAPSGSVGQGGTCGGEDVCSRGLVCGDDLRCQTPCAPADGGSCPAATMCIDETPRYGVPVGLCR